MRREKITLDIAFNFLLNQRSLESKNQRLQQKCYQEAEEIGG